jgi:hypothetical protein
MTDEIVRVARLMKVTEALVAELDRQGVAEALADLRFDPIEMAKIVIKAADGASEEAPGFVAARYRLSSVPQLGRRQDTLRAI